MTTSSHKHRILLADDDRAVLDSTGRVLMAFDFDVDCVTNASDALHAMSESGYDLLITDIHMPGNQNLELLRAMKELDFEPPVILITGQPSVATSVAALRLSAIDYLIKPIDPEQLVERARKGIEKGSALRFVDSAQRRAQEVAQVLASIREVLDMPGHSPSLNAILQAAPSPPQVAEPFPGLSAEERDALSNRETEVLLLLAEGKRPQEVAKTLFISQHTVRNHVRAIYAKLDVHSQVELLRKVLG